jgi:hypothetical protein
MDSDRSAQRGKGWGSARLLFAGVVSSLLTILIVFSALYLWIPDVPQISAPKQSMSPVSTSLSSESSVVAQAQSVPPEPIITNYRICLGEYERNCPPHDVYLYCYEDVASWAHGRCDETKIVTLGSQPGNKCGYSSVQVICIKKR